MNRLKKTITKAAVTLTMVAMLAPGLASALTVEELQQQINQLMAQLSQLQATGTAATGMPAACVGITFTRNLARNSVGNDVRCLQALLNQLNVRVSNVGPGSPGMETTFFGDATLAAVQRYQTLNNISPALGYVGPITRASLNQNLSTFTTGPVATPTPGCPAGALFNSMTGAPCPTTTTPATGLTGVANIKSISNLSQYSNEQVGEGQNNVIVLGKEIEMDNTGNARLQQVRVVFDGSATGSDIAAQSPTASNRLDRYTNRVSVWLNGQEVGSSSAMDFSRDSSGVYSRTILLSGNAILNSGAKNNLTVAVNGVNNLDSADVGIKWNVMIESIRYVDATGAIITDSRASLTSGTSLTFESLASSTALELRLNVASNNPVAASREASKTTDTKDVVLANFTLRAQGDRIWLDELPVSIVVTSTNSEKVSDVVARAMLKIGSRTYTEIVPATLSTGGCSVTDSGTTHTCVITFDDLDYNLEANQNVQGSVVVDVKRIDVPGVGNFKSGTAVKANITNANLVAGVAEDRNGNTIASGSRKGTVTGENQKFFAEGITVDNFTSSSVANTNTSGLNVSQTFTVSFRVTSFGNTFYIPKTVSSEYDAGFRYAVQKGGANQTIAEIVRSASSLTSTAQTVGQAFEVPDGESRTFTATIEVKAGSANGFVRIQGVSVNHDVSSSLGSQTTYNLVPVQNFQTQERKVD